MNLFLKAMFALFFNSYVLAQNVLPGNLDLNKLKDLGFSPAQLRKLKNSKSIQNMEPWSIWVW